MNVSKVEESCLFDLHFVIESSFLWIEGFQTFLNTIRKKFEKQFKTVFDQKKNDGIIMTAIV